MEITKNQLRAVQAVMSRMAADREERLELLGEMSGRPIASAKDLTFDEAKLLLERFGGEGLRAVTQRKQQLKATIYHLSMEIGFLNASYADADTPDDRQMNMAKVDGWLLSHGVVKKRVRDMSVSELGRTIGQMKAAMRH